MVKGSRSAIGGWQYPFLRLGRLAVRIQGKVFHVMLFALPLHNINRVVQHDGGDDADWLGRHDGNIGKASQQDWQAAKMVQMAVGEDDQVNGFIFEDIKIR